MRLPNLFSGAKSVDATSNPIPDTSTQKRQLSKNGHKNHRDNEVICIKNQDQNDMTEKTQMKRNTIATSRSSSSRWHQHPSSTINEKHASLRKLIRETSQKRIESCDNFQRSLSKEGLPHIRPHTKSIKTGQLSKHARDHSSGRLSSDEPLPLSAPTTPDQTETRLDRNQSRKDQKDILVNGYDPLYP